MADEAIVSGIGKDSGEDGAGHDRHRGRMPSGQRRALLGVLAVLLLSGLGAGGYALGLFASAPAADPVLATAPADAEERAPALASAPLYYDLPDLLVELETGGEVPILLKISATLEVKDEATLGRLNAVMPRVLDNFQIYLSELGPEDLQGSAGFDRVSEALLLRVNAAIRPAQIRDVRLMEVLVQ